MEFMVRIILLMEARRPNWPRVTRFTINPPIPVDILDHVVYGNQADGYYYRLSVNTVELK